MLAIYIWVESRLELSCKRGETLSVHVVTTVTSLRLSLNNERGDYVLVMAGGCTGKLSDCVMMQTNFPTQCQQKLKHLLRNTFMQEYRLSWSVM